ncbi:FAD:protein FMN transferase [Marinimicrobium locisalis]|uniref:FAD:protein FMN transferase n=1 Tax=Marinimicrobium locisalis TaxID=546022 RepID=UPI0032221B9D
MGPLLTGCDWEAEATRDFERFSGNTMGTTYHVTVVAEEGASLSIDTDAIQRGLDRELAQINQQMSTYIEDSELMRFNRAPVGEWQALSEPLAAVLAVSRKVSERSDGAFDITVGPLVNLWGFGPEAEPEEVPTEAEILALRQQVGYRKLNLDGRRAKRLADIQVDLSAVAKGYGVDHVARWLEAQGVENYLVEIGGEVYLSGVSPRGDAWRIGVEQPTLLQEGGRMALALTDIGMATSGDYRNYYERDGKRYSHTLDPRTGRPIVHKLVSVTVLAKTTAEADAWATALNVLGPKAGMALAEREQLAVYMIVKANEGYEDRFSSAFEPYRS